jgi:hypothetical protein
MPTPDRLLIDSDSAAQSNSVVNNGHAPKYAVASYSRQNCAELEASPVSLSNWAGPSVALGLFLLSELQRKFATP